MLLLCVRVLHTELFMLLTVINFYKLLLLPLLLFLFALFVVGIVIFAIAIIIENTVHLFLLHFDGIEQSAKL